MDDGRGGNYVSQVGYLSPYLTPTFTAAQGVVRSLTYRFRYRARNCKGWGPFSDELYVLAVSNPSAPPSVQRVSSDSTQITLKLFPTNDNGGSVVTDYELYRNDGTFGSVYVPVTGYSYVVNGFTYQVVVADEQMIAGRFYQFVFRTKNILGYSEWSPVVAFGIADKPLKANAPFEIHQG